MLDNYNRLPYHCQRKTANDTLIQNVMLRELVNIMGATIIDIHIELKMKTSKTKYLEIKLFYFYYI